MVFGIGFFTAKQEILLGPARLQHLDGDLLVQGGQRAAFDGHSPRGILRPASYLVDRTEGEEPGQTGDADGHDFVSETNGKATHGDSCF